MLNSIVMDLKRSLKSKQFYFVLVFSALIAFFTCVILQVSMSSVGDAAATMSKNDMSFKLIIKFFFTTPLYSLLLAMYVTSFITKDFENRYVINVVSYMKDKGHYAIAKFISMSCISAILMIFVMIMCWLIGMFFLGSDAVRILDPLVDLEVIGVEFIVNEFLIAFYVIVAIITRKSNIASMVSILVVMFITQVYSFADQYLPFTLENFSVIANMGSVGVVPNTQWFSLLGLSVLYTAIILIASVVVMRKKDI
ncbi:MAG: hypothetical protein RSC10_06695 [Longicatena sp.]